MGEYLPANSFPEQSCAILYLESIESKKVIGLCSGEIISTDQIQTAGHCEQDLSNHPTVIKCPNGILRVVTKRETAEGFQGSGNQNDHAVLTVEKPFGVKPIRLPKSSEESNDLIKKNDCYVFGYGLNNSNKAGEPLGIKINTQGGPTWGAGMSGLSGSSTPRQGDSGAGVLCKDNIGS